MKLIDEFKKELGIDDVIRRADIEVNNSGTIDESLIELQQALGQWQG